MKKTKASFLVFILMVFVWEVMVTKGYKRIVKLPTGNWIDELGTKYNGAQTINH